MGWTALFVLGMTLGLAGRRSSLGRAGLGITGTATLL
jgi:hypothetical protein